MDKPGSVNRARARFHWLRIAKKRRALYNQIWPDSRDYLATVSLNEHARHSLGKRCSCEMCSQRDPDGWRAREARQRLADWDIDLTPEALAELRRP